MKIKKKILKNFFIQNILAFIVFLYIYLVKFTSSIKLENQKIPEKYWDTKKPFILAFWHSQLMMISFSWKFDQKLNVLASGHSDGRFGSIVGSYFDLNNIATYNNKKQSTLRPLIELINKKKYIGITPDGPRGPKEKVSEGIIKLAKYSSIPIIPIGFWSSNNFKLNSWDSFLVTLPFSKCSFVWGDPIIISKDQSENKIESYKQLLEKKISENIERAKTNCR